MLGDNMELIIRQEYRLIYSATSPNNRLLSIRAIIDDDIVVYRWWSRPKKRWIYEVKTLKWFETREKLLFPVTETKRVSTSSLGTEINGNY